MTPLSPVLVAGAGPSGLVAALTLLQNNIPVRIVTKDPSYRIGQRGAGIWPRTFEVFHFLRVLEAHQRGRPIIPMREYEPGSIEPVKTFPLHPHSDPTPSIPYYNPKLLGQEVLESILRSHLQKYGCSVELGTELVSFEDDGERVLSKLIKRKDGEETTEMFEASYLIGADGAKGVVRKQLGLTFLGETREDFTCVVGDLCLEMEGIDRNHWHCFGRRSSDFLMMRPSDEIAADGFQIVMAMKNYEAKQLFADQTLMLKCMSELTGHEIHLRKAIFLSAFQTNIRMANKFGVRRVFIVGDAAHVHSPTGGQGLNSGVQDSFNLAWKLALVCKDLAPATLLDSYTAERLPVIAEMLSITTGILNQFRVSASVEAGMTREKKLNMLGVNYRSSPLVLDEFSDAEPVSAYGALMEGVLVAGDRAPDAPELRLFAADGGTETVTKLFDVFSPGYHTVLMFVPDAASVMDVLEVLTKCPGDAVRPVVVLPQGSKVAAGTRVDVIVDERGHAYSGYLAAKGEKRVVVVRPDGVVGAMVRGAEGLGTYFSRIFVEIGRVGAP